jgi:Rps23 Pro-64 3,4-dihydroxylase Tpa1-like proline 4-hydroxylase
VSAQFHSNPVKLLIVDDFFDAAMQERALDAFVSLETRMHQGSIVRGQAEQPNLFLKRNLNLWLGTVSHDAESGPVSALLSAFKDRFWSDEMRAALKTTGDLLFEYLAHANREAFLLSAYGPGDYYYEHVDEFPSVTASFMLCSRARKFTGGDFFLASAGMAEGATRKVKRVEFVPGRLVLFPSRTPHWVDKVAMESQEFRDRRFSLQYWATYVSAF